MSATRTLRAAALPVHRRGPGRAAYSACSSPTAAASSRRSSRPTRAPSDSVDLGLDRHRRPRPSGSCCSGSTAPPAGSASAARRSPCSSPSRASPTDAQVDALRAGLLEAVDRMKADGTLPPASDLVDEALDSSDLNGFVKAAIRALPDSVIDQRAQDRRRPAPHDQRSRPAHPAGQPGQPRRPHAADQRRRHEGRRAGPGRPAARPPLSLRFVVRRVFAARLTPPAG